MLVAMLLWMSVGDAHRPRAPTIPTALFLVFGVASLESGSAFHEIDVERHKSDDAEKKRNEEGVEGHPEPSKANGYFVRLLRRVAAEPVLIGLLAALSASLIGLSAYFYMRADRRRHYILSAALFVSGQALVLMILYAVPNLGHG